MAETKTGEWWSDTLVTFRIFFGLTACGGFLTLPPNFGVLKTVGYKVYKQPHPDPGLLNTAAANDETVPDIDKAKVVTLTIFLTCLLILKQVSVVADDFNEHPSPAPLPSITPRAATRKKVCSSPSSYSYADI
jgi:hypothetical protein